MSDAKKRVCAVVGVGPGNGAAFARRFAAEGYRVALLSRSTALSTALAAELGDARAYACDVGDAQAVARAFGAIRDELGDVEVVVYNAGRGVWGTLDEVSAEQFEAAFRVNALGAFHVAKEVVPAMKRAGHGAFVFVGATASRRGVPRTTAFAPAKAAQRAFAESLARQLWPAGIHVALMILDGIVDLAATRARMPDKPDEFFVEPADVADLAFRLTEQPRSAWSFEVEARPFGEKW